MQQVAVKNIRQGTRACFLQYVQYMNEHSHIDYIPCGNGLCCSFSAPRLAGCHAKVHVIHIVREFTALSIMCIVAGGKKGKY